MQMDSRALHSLCIRESDEERTICLKLIKYVNERGGTQITDLKHQATTL